MCRYNAPGFPTQDFIGWQQPETKLLFPTFNIDVIYFMNVLKRNNVVVKGKGEQVMLFSHGFGCDQNMWRYVAPHFEEDYTVVLFDHVGAGRSDISAWEPAKYASLDGYADDIIDIIRELGSKKVIFVGHSVSAIIGAIASIGAPELFAFLIMVGPSPCYIDDEHYKGGFSQTEIGELLESLDNNHLGWSLSMAPVIMGNPERPELAEELANSFCQTDPAIAHHFARTTFLSDKRDILPCITIPSLLLQCTDDLIAPLEVGKYMHRQIKDSTLVIMNATGHCPNLSAPEETIKAIKRYLS